MTMQSTLTQTAPLQATNKKSFKPHKMHAAVVEQFGKPLTLQERDVPTPGPGQILVKTEACGVCHTDLHAANGDWPVKPTLPFIPGHEAIGRVVGIGAGVTIVKEGDRVGVPWLYSACGHCEYCLSAWETVCPEAQFGGYTKNGGFAEYLLADPNYVAHVPAGLTPQEAARRSSARASRLTTASKKRKRSPGSGSRFLALADLAILRCNTPKPWDCWSAASTSMMANWHTPSARAPISSLMPKPATRPPP